LYSLLIDVLNYQSDKASVHLIVIINE